VWREFVKSLIQVGIFRKTRCRQMAARANIVLAQARTHGTAAPLFIGIGAEVLWIPACAGTTLMNAVDRLDAAISAALQISRNRDAGKSET
jgi:hypothetical protein